MIIEQKQKIGGEIVCIGKIHADGSEELKWLKDPIHNQITLKGIENLLRWNGSDALPSGTADAIGNEISSLYLPCQAYQTNQYGYDILDQRDTSVTRTGVLWYSAYGDGLGGFDPDTDIELVNRTSNITSTFRKGLYFNGTNCVSVAGNHQLQYRVTHTYPTAQEHQYVNEVGFYHKVEPSGEYTLFSRVELDEPYELDTGEQLIITYQLNIKFPDYPTHISDFFGLKDKDGNTLQANETTCIKTSSTFDWTRQYKGNCLYYYRNDSSTIAPFIFPIIHNYYPYGLPKFALTYSTSHDGSRQYGWRPIWGLKNERELRAIFVQNDVTNLEMMKTNGPTLTNTKYQESAIITQILPFTVGTKYRDYVLTLPTFYPYLDSGENYIDIAVMIFNGVAYRFGYNDNGTWVSQKLRKYGNQMFKLKYRMSYETDNP